ncbi:DUF3429 domain-containing protein [Sphingomonas sp. KRR8]|uniref:DUF3429 domain-containing protein n=1 Tax=Sphingomonas sp. KRR8 TaxID=2942996 RepID=UPI0020202728|nr:DUF3429 domain-containing protein [Sphingomonas sp. KRR8]URD61417.1 DUF3429 domain-containing protein [Sphingomonas sp. KRR8]
MERRIPAAPLVLGLAGLLPPLASAAAISLDLGGFGYVAREATLLYAALIASFLGGSWWAFASRAERPSWLLMLISVVPSLTAWAMLLALDALNAGTGLALLILLTPLVDLQLQRAALAAPWWLRLRVPLSLTLAVELLFVTFCR